MFKKVLISLFLALVILPSQSALAVVTIPSDYYPEGAPTITGEKPVGDAQQNQISQQVEFYRNTLTFRITNLVLYVAGLVAIFFVVYNGFRMVTSAGSDEVITQTKKGLTWAIVGLILIILSYSIMRFIISVPFNLADESQVQAPTSGGGVAPPAEEQQTVERGNAPAPAVEEPAAELTPEERAKADTGVDTTQINTSDLDPSTTGGGRTGPAPDIPSEQYGRMYPTPDVGVSRDIKP